MAFLIGFLTLVMVLDCVIVVLLVLIQLPKKDAGAGLAFGGSATDALFGAGSGTVLTKITKYAAATFFALALILSILQSNYHKSAGAAFTKRLNATGTMPPAPFAAPAAAPSATNPTAIGLTTNAVTQPTPEASNVSAPVIAPAPAPTNPAANPAPPK
jgi:preprotein translocase subunit SecG